jgi:hypothetical protein
MPRGRLDSAFFTWSFCFIPRPSDWMPEESSVAPFEIQKDVKFPPEYLALMQTEIFKELTSTKVFAEVVTEGQTASTPDAHLLRLTGLITNYNQGNRERRGSGCGGD